MYRGSRQHRRTYHLRLHDALGGRAYSGTRSHVPFRHDGVPARGVYFGRLEAVSSPKQAPSLDIGHVGNDRKWAPRIDFPKEGRHAHWSELPGRGVELSLKPRAGYLWGHNPPILLYYREVGGKTCTPGERINNTNSTPIWPLHFLSRSTAAAPV